MTYLQLSNAFFLNFFCLYMAQSLDKNVEPLQGELMQPPTSSITLLKHYLHQF